MRRPWCSWMSLRPKKVGRSRSIRWDSQQKRTRAVYRGPFSNCIMTFKDGATAQHIRRQSLLVLIFKNNAMDDTKRVWKCSYDHIWSYWSIMLIIMIMLNILFIIIIIVIIIFCFDFMERMVWNFYSCWMSVVVRIEFKGIYLFFGPIIERTYWHLRWSSSVFSWIDWSCNWSLA